MIVLCFLQLIIHGEERRKQGLIHALGNVVFLNVEKTFKCLE